MGRWYKYANEPTQSKPLSSDFVTLSHLWFHLCWKEPFLRQLFVVDHPSIAVTASVISDEKTVFKNDFGS